MHIDVIEFSIVTTIGKGDMEYAENIIISLIFVKYILSIPEGYSIISWVPSMKTIQWTDTVQTQ